MPVMYEVKTIKLMVMEICNKKINHNVLNNWFRYISEIPAYVKYVEDYKEVLILYACACLYKINIKNRFYALNREKVRTALQDSLFLRYLDTEIETARKKLKQELAVEINELNVSDQNSVSTSIDSGVEYLTGSQIANRKYLSESTVRTIIMKQMNLKYSRNSMYSLQDFETAYKAHKDSLKRNSTVKERK